MCVNEWDKCIIIVCPSKLKIRLSHQPNCLLFIIFLSWMFLLSFSLWGMGKVKGKLEQCSSKVWFGSKDIFLISKCQYYKL